MVALYAYIAASEDELSCTEGDRISLTSLGFDFGEGWVEVTIDGRIGILPSSYVSSIANSFAFTPTPADIDQFLMRAFQVEEI